MNVLWDFDGTLFDTYPAFTETMYKILNKKVPKPTILKELKVSFSHAAKVFQLTDEDVKRFKKLETSLSSKFKPPFPYVEEILKRMNTNVIMTHKPKKEVMAILDDYDWHHYFKEMVTIDDGFPRKPDPSAYKYLHDKYNLDLVIGDRLLDIIPAKKLGIKTCLFQNEEVGADYYLTSYENFFQVVSIC